MKKNLFALIAFLSVAASAHATLVLSNSFGYPDGALDTVSAGSPLGVWVLHSGITNQLQVVSGQAIVGGANTEDVNTALTNASFPTPFTSGKLYASFIVNWSLTPVGSGGTYFFHFKDTGTSNFRARVWAMTNGADAGFVRVGISAAGNTPVVIATDLPVSTDCKLVVRYDLDAKVATLWINPNSENSLVNKADSTDVPAALPISTVCLREGNATGNSGTHSFDNLLVATAFAEVAVVGGAPTISSIGAQSIAANSSTGPVPFQVNDVETPANSLVVTGTSTNTTLVPNNPANVTFGGSGNNRTVTITPALNQQGIALISVGVTDGDNLKATNSFLVTVGAPSISGIADQTTPTNTPTAAIPFTVNDAETPNNLTVTGTSSNPTLIQNSDIAVSGTGTSRTVTITPEPDQAGLATITLTVSDPGGLTASTTFNITVFPRLGLLLGDTFTYPDGYIVTSSGGFWVRHSGSSNDSFIVSDQVHLTGTNDDDVHAFFTNSFAATANSGIILYSAFTVNFSELPKGNGGGYFAHFKDLLSNFRARVFAETNGAAAGMFRIGVANGGFAVAAVPQDLSLGTTYLIVTRYNVGTATSTIWVNPASESGSPSASATDLTTAVDISSYSFRQDGPSGAIGNLLIDNLLIGTTFSDVVQVTTPSPIPLIINLAGTNVVLMWSNPTFTLESSVNAGGPYTRILTATSPYTNAASGSASFFRLIYP